MKRRNYYFRRYWPAIPVGIGLIIFLGTTENNKSYRDCMKTIHVDVAPIEGETWEQHAVRMDEAAAQACKNWS